MWSNLASRSKCCVSVPSQGDDAVIGPVGTGDEFGEGDGEADVVDSGGRCGRG